MVSVSMLDRVTDLRGVKYCTVLCSVVQCSVVQCSTVQYSKVFGFICGIIIVERRRGVELIFVERK